MLVIAILGHSKLREVVHSTTSSECSTVEISYKNGSLGVAIYYYVFVCI